MPEPTNKREITDAFKRELERQAIPRPVLTLVRTNPNSSETEARAIPKKVLDARYASRLSCGGMAGFVRFQAVLSVRKRSTGGAAPKPPGFWSLGSVHQWGKRAIVSRHNRRKP
jgi:hypothetical protein